MLILETPVDPFSLLMFMLCSKYPGKRYLLENAVEKCNEHILSLLSYV